MDLNKKINTLNHLTCNKNVKQFKIILSTFLLDIINLISFTIPSNIFFFHAYAHLPQILSNINCRLIFFPIFKMITIFSPHKTYNEFFNLF